MENEREMEINYEDAVEDEYDGDDDNVDDERPLKERMSDLVNDFLNATTHPFAYGGSLQNNSAGNQPLFTSFFVNGLGEIKLPISAEDIQRLKAVSSKAPFGKGTKTVTDLVVRDVWQIDGDDVYCMADQDTEEMVTNEVSGASASSNDNNEDAVSIENHFENEDLNKSKSIFSPALQHHVRSALKEHLQVAAEEVGVIAELYKLLLYEEGGHFQRHRDTEKAPGMFATYLLELPVATGLVHEGGRLIIRQAGKQVVIDTAASRRAVATNEHNNDMYEVLFYADCEHELERVTSGYRVVLAFNLIWQSAATTTSATDSLSLQSLLSLSAYNKYLPNVSTFVAETRALVQRWLKDDNNNQSDPTADPQHLLALPLQHHYTQTNFSVQRLKGHDALLAQVFLSALAGDVQTVLVLRVKHTSGQPSYDCDCHGRYRNGYNEDDEDDEEDDEDKDEDEDEDDEEEEDDEEDDEVNIVQPIVTTTSTSVIPLSCTLNTTSGMVRSDDSISKYNMTSSDKKRKLIRHTMEEVFDSDLEEIWLDGTGQVIDPLPIDPGKDILGVDDEEYEFEDPDEEEFEGYTGNAGPTLDYWYHKAYLVVYPMSFLATFPLRFEMDVYIQQKVLKYIVCTTASSNGMIPVYTCKNIASVKLLLNKIIKFIYNIDCNIYKLAILAHLVQEYVIRDQLTKAIARKHIFENNCLMDMIYLVQHCYHDKTIATRDAKLLDKLFAVYKDHPQSFIDVPKYLRINNLSDEAAVVFKWITNSYYSAGHKARLLNSTKTSELAIIQDIFLYGDVQDLQRLSQQLTAFTTSVSAQCRKEENLLQLFLEQRVSDQLIGRLHDEARQLLTILYRARKQHLDSMNPPPFSWAITSTTYAGLKTKEFFQVSKPREIDSFLSSNTDKIVTIKGFGSIRDARYYAEKYLSNSHQVALKVETGGSGKNAFVRLEKSTTFYDKKKLFIKGMCAKLAKIEALFPVTATSEYTNTNTNANNSSSSSSNVNSTTTIAAIIQNDHAVDLTSDSPVKITGEKSDGIKVNTMTEIINLLED